MKQLIEQFKKLQGDNSPTIGNDLVFRDIASDTIYIKSYTEAYKKRLDAWVKNNPSKWGYVTEDEFRIVLEKTNKVIEEPKKVKETIENISWDKPVINANITDEVVKTEVVHIENTEIKDEIIVETTTGKVETAIDSKESIQVTEKPKRGRKAKI